MSLEAVYRIAVDQAPSLAIARYRVDSAEAQSAEAAGAVCHNYQCLESGRITPSVMTGPYRRSTKTKVITVSVMAFAHGSLFDVARFRELQRREVLSDLSESELQRLRLSYWGRSQIRT